MFKNIIFLKTIKIEIEKYRENYVEKGIICDHMPGSHQASLANHHIEAKVISGRMVRCRSYPVVLGDMSWKNILDISKNYLSGFGYNIELFKSTGYISQS